MTRAAAVGERLAGLRDDFDRSFTEPLRRHDTDHDELLAIQAGGRLYAMRLSQTSGVYPDLAVTPLPGPLPALLGVAVFAGSIVPVHDLGTLLGHPVPERPRWLVLAAGTPPLALAFHKLDGHLQVPTDTIITEGHDGTGSLRGMVPLPGGTRPIVDVPATRAAVHRLTGYEERRT